MKRLSLCILAIGIFLFPFSIGWRVEAEVNTKNLPLFTFSVLSDLHITPWDLKSQRLFSHALSDHAVIAPHSKLMVLNGDLTNGHVNDYSTLDQLLRQQPRAPIAATMGNHEYYAMWDHDSKSKEPVRLSEHWTSEQAIRLFTRFFHQDHPYYDLWVEGYHFIFLSGEAYRDVLPQIGEDAWLSPEQLAWLKKTLGATAEDTDPSSDRAASNKPVFVFLHQPLPHTLDGTDAERGIAQHQELVQLLASVPQVMFFSGHTHWDLGRTKQINPQAVYSVGSASIRQVYDESNKPASPAQSQSLLVEVYKDRVDIRGREHTTKRWLNRTSYLLKEHNN
ncbi:3',5'-cyclic adenosine monophosphate phosphodiesterase CpdA [compost metagenome]